MKKQILSMLLAIVMVVGLIPGFAVTISADESGTDNSSYLPDIDEGIKTVEKGTYVNGFAADGSFQPAEQDANGTYLIANAGQLYWFAEKVNSGNTDIDGKLVADIVVNENVLKEDGTLNDGSFRSWTSIGNADNPYTGKFDGQNHTISGLYYHTNYSKEIALFGRLTDGSIIQNLGLVDSWFYAFGQNIGGIAVSCYESSIINCYNASSIGGLSYVGGITANATYNSVVENCYNFGRITGSNRYIGGIVGSGGSYAIIKECYNAGTVSGYTSVGGIVGASNTDGRHFIKNCYNIGTVSGDRSIGGIMGYSQNSGNNIENCHNIGSIVGSENIGGILGRDTYEAAITNCYYLNSCGAEGVGTSKSAERFAAGEVAYLLGDAFGQTIGTENYPVIGGKKVDQITSGTYSFQPADEWIADGYAAVLNSDGQYDIVKCYKVEIEQPEDGKVETDNDCPTEGEDVTVTVTPDEGMDVADVIVRDENDNEIPVTDNGDGTYTYEQPAGNVSVDVSFCVKTYKVIFVDDNGTVLDEQTVEHGKSAAAPVDPTRIGYTFTGWDKTFESITEPLTVTAQYSVNKYTVTLVTNDGEILDENVTEYTYGIGAELPVNVTKSGYSFDGWYDNENCSGSAITEISASDIGDKTFYAKWTSISAPVVIPNLPIIIPAYPPVVEVGIGGDVAVTPTKPEKGDTVTITPDSEAGYEVDKITVTEKNGKSLTVIENGDGTYSFKQPIGKVNIEVTFKEIIVVSQDDEIFEEITEVCHGDDTCPMYGYTDLDMTEWYHDGVHFCIENKLMNGTSTTSFEPGATTSRAMIVTTLWRLAGEPVVNYAMRFEDVDADQWYTEAIRWASAEKIVEGYGNGRFGTNDAITREQLAAILYRYEQKNGGGFKGLWMFRMDYVDLADVSDWAYEAICWMNMNGIVNGKPDKVLDPKGSATRAEAATMLYRYCEISGMEEK